MQAKMLKGKLVESGMTQEAAANKTGRQRSAWPE
jgi:hypothetical protein